MRMYRFNTSSHYDRRAIHYELRAIHYELIVGAMASDLTAKVEEFASTVPSDELGKGLVMLADEAGFDDDCQALHPVAALDHADSSALPAFFSMLEEGTAGAVDDVNELYEAGLPEGLPGGLADLARSQQSALVARTKGVRALKVKCDEAVKQTREETPRAQSIIIFPGGGIASHPAREKDIPSLWR